MTLKKNGCQQHSLKKAIQRHNKTITKDTSTENIPRVTLLYTESNKIGRLLRKHIQTVFKHTNSVKRTQV